MLALFLSPWLPAMLLLTLACGARFLSDSWLAPGAFAALLWSLVVWISMLATDFPIYASAIWVIVLFVMVLQLGAFIGEEVAGRRVGVVIRQEEEASNIGAPNAPVVRICVACTIVAFAGAIYFVFWSFWRFDLSVSPISFLGLGHLWSVQRYDYGELEPWPVRLTIMWVYPAALLGGIAFATGKNRGTKFLTLLPFLAAFLVGAIVAARAGMLISLICWFSGFFGVKHWQYKGAYPLFRRRFVLVFGALSLAVFVLFVLVDVLRQSVGGQISDITLDVQRLSKYSFGSLAAFSSWFHQYKPDSATFGAYTFGGIFDLLGLQHREIGLYEAMVTLPGGEETNIYTALRGLIQDFTLGGAVFLAFLVSFVSGLLLSSLSRRTWISILFGAGYYAFILGSPLTSVFTYNGIVLAWIVAAIVLRSSFKLAGARALGGLSQTSSAVPFI
jgi:oligosaccharide repeat unit polymerase